MRRGDKELTDQKRIRAILDDALFCHLAMCDAGGRPYCLPICFVSRNGRIILHSANEGRKIEVLHENPRVCITIERDCRLIRAETPCGYGMAYESVLIEGICRFLEGPEKSSALGILSEKYAGYSGGPYTERQLERIAVLEIEILSVSGRRSGPNPGKTPEEP